MSHTIDSKNGPARGSSHTQSPPQRRLLYFHEIPTWQQENEYLLSGYRPTTNSYYRCATSCFDWHNETINIVSHILGIVLFAALPWHFEHQHYLYALEATPTDLILFRIYSWGVAICFVFSVICHAVWNHSPAVSSIGNSLDYLGIVVLMWGASIPSIYYGFACDTMARNFHWTLTSSLAVGCVIFTMHPRFRQPQFRSSRASMYAGFGLSSVLFIAHGIVSRGVEAQTRCMSLRWMLLMAVLNIIGAAAYAARVPERAFPYRFDFVGASHQIFHVMVVFAGLAHYVGLVRAFEVVRGGEYDCGL